MDNIRYIKIGLVLVLIFAVGIFTFFKTHDLVLGTALTIESPKNGETLSDSFVVVKGIAEGSALLTVNGAKVLTDEKGSFQQEMLLGLGYNVIEVRSLDRFNREAKTVLELVYRPSEASSSAAVAFFSN